MNRGLTARGRIKGRAGKGLEGSEGAERITVASRAELRRWLSRHASRETGLWLVTWKVGDARHLPYGDLVEELIAAGWVDSQPRALDAARSMRRIAPRDLASTWSRANRERAARLEAAGRMTARGRRAVQAAKASGAWDRTEAAEAGVIPDDLEKALKDAGACATFDGFPPSSRWIILEWIGSARTPETRARRISETAAEAKAGRKAHHYRR